MVFSVFKITWVSIILPNLTKKKTEYIPFDKITIYLNYYFQGKKLRIPSGISVLFKDWNKNWKQGRKSDPILKSDINHAPKNILLKQKSSEVNQIIDKIKLNSQIPVIELVKNNLKGFKKEEVKKTFENLEVYKDILVLGCGVGCRFGDLISLRLDNYQFSEDRSKGYCENFCCKSETRH